MRAVSGRKCYAAGMKKLLSFFIILTQIQFGLFAQSENERIDNLIEQGNFDEAI